jgi:hypothetical protein
MIEMVRPGDLLAHDPECRWLVLAVDGTRAICADLYDGLTVASFDLSTGVTPRPLADQAQECNRLRDVADRSDREAAELERSARERRACAERCRGYATLIERLRFARNDA